MKKQKRAAGCSEASKRQRTIVRDVRVTNLNAICGIDQQALFRLMAVVNPHRHAELFYACYNALLGFSLQVQAELVEALNLYFIGEAHTITGIQHIDAVLGNLYREIDSFLLNTKKTNEHGK